MNENNSAWLGCLGFVVMLGFGLAQIVAGYQGIAFYLGTTWATFAMILALLLRFTLLVTVGAFFGARDAWGWHWFWALIFAAPTLLLMIPGVIAAGFDKITSIFRKS